MTPKIYVSDITRLKDENVLREAMHLIPSWRRERIERFRFIKDKAASAGAFLLLSHALEGEGISAGYDMAEFYYNDHGKPYLQPPGNEQIFFNLSHSGKYVMCILSDEENGCDVQEIKKGGDNIAERFFSQKEKEYLKSLDADERVRTFYELWALKESCLKAAGSGLAHELSSFSVDIKTLKQEGLDALATCELRLYNIDREYVFAACARNLPKEPEIIDLSASDHYSERTGSSF